MGRDLKIYIDIPKKSGDRNKHWIPSESNDFVLRWPLGEDEGEGEFGGQWLQSVQDRLLRQDPTDPHNQIPSTFEDEATAVFPQKELDKPLSIRARVLLSPAVKQRQLLGSIRFSGSDKTPAHSVPPPVNWERAFRVLVEREKNPPNKQIKQVPRNKSKYVFAPDAVCDVVLSSLGILQKDDRHFDLGFATFKPPEDNQGEAPNHIKLEGAALPKIAEHPSGLIVIAGGTGTGKSTYARGIVLRYLLRLAILRMAKLHNAKKPLSQYEPPHLVTFEDPIESWSLNFADTTDDPTGNSIDLLKSSQSDLQCGIRVTCRSKMFDVDNLGSACMHALRQKPNVVYIGECREAKDWNLALELGGTGHLVVTTCHSSSLVDTFVKLAGPGNRDAQSRQNLASSLCGVLHLKSDSFVPGQSKQLRANPIGINSSSFNNFSASQTFFSLWRNTPESVSNFVVDGLASLVIEEDNVLSRSGLSRKILEYQKSDPRELLELENDSDRQAYFDALKVVASEMAFKIDMGLA
jgi:Type II/IV secretion system protein